MYIEKTETERLTIRELALTDINDWEAFFVNNLSLDYLGFDINRDKHTLAKEWIEIQLERYQNNRYGHQALIEKSSGQFIGQCGLLTQTFEENSIIEIGYHILPEFWGKGYATEAAKKIRDFAFENKMANELFSIIDIRNLASQRVAEKSGMIIEKQANYFHLDVYLYKITHKEWLNLATK